VAQAEIGDLHGARPRDDLQVPERVRLERLEVDGGARRQVEPDDVFARRAVELDLAVDEDLVEHQQQARAAAAVRADRGEACAVPAEIRAHPRAGAQREARAATQARGARRPERLLPASGVKTGQSSWSNLKTGRGVGYGRRCAGHFSAFRRRGPR